MAALYPAVLQLAACVGNEQRGYGHIGVKISHLLASSFASALPGARQEQETQHTDGCSTCTEQKNGRCWGQEAEHAKGDQIKPSHTRKELALY